MTICVIYPVVESTGALKDVSVGLWRDFRTLLGGRKPKVEDHRAAVDA